MRKISVSAMDGILVGRRERIHSGVLIGEYVDSCALPQKSYLQTQFRIATESKLLAAVTPHHPFVDTDTYVASSDVSLVGYICTHVCLIYVFQRDFSLTSSSAWTSTFSLLPQLRSCTSAGSCRQSGFSAFFICSCLYSDKLSFRMCLLLVCSVCLGHETHVCNAWLLRA